MKLTYKNKMATSLALISILTFQPTISFAKEDPISNFFTKMFSSKPSTIDQLTKKQIYKSDVNSLKLGTLIDFEFSIQDILKSYLDKKNINNVLNNISDKDDKNLNADSLDQFDNLLPKSKTDKINGKAIIRLAKKLGKDEKTIFEIKKNIILQVVASQGITLVYNEKSKKTDVAKVEKEDELDIKEASSSNMSVIGAIAGLAAIGGGGGGGSSSSSCDSSTDGCYRDTTSGIYSSEYSSNTALASQNILTLNNYGYTGSGIKVGVVDTGIDFEHQELNGKTALGKDFASSASGFDDDEDGHGTHVASIIAGDRDGTGMRGMAYDAILYSYKVDNDGDGTSLEGLVSDSGIASIYNQHVTDGIKVSNNSWGGSAAVNTISEATMRASRSAIITSLTSFQNNGGVTVFSAGNNGRTQPDSYGAMPYRITELKDNWLLVTAVDLDLKQPNYTNECGLAYDFCVAAVGGSDNQNVGGVYAAKANDPDGYVRYSGTSMAAPHVSGLAAALMEKFPSLSNTAIVTRIKNTASYNGLTDKSGNSSDSLTTSQKQAIWGSGLINGTAASARIGSYTYPTSSNINESSHDISSSKISLPNGLSKSTFEKIKNKDFGVFDSFDGARFFVKGSEVFKLSNTQSPIINISQETHKQKRRITSLKYYSEGNNSAGLYASAIGQAEFVHSSSSFWNEKSGLFRGVSMISDEEIRQLEWSMSFSDSMSFRTFTRTLTNDNSLYGSGLSFVYEPKDNLKKAFIGFSKNNPNLDLNLFENSNVSSETTTLEIGGEYSLINGVTAFLGMSKTDIEDVASNYNSVGLQNAKTMGITTGINIKSKKHSFIIGFSKPEELNEGELSLLSPTGRKPNGEIIWEKNLFKLKQENFTPAILGWQSKISQNLNFDANLEESRYENGKIGSMQLSINYVF